MSWITSRNIRSCRGHRLQTTIGISPREGVAIKGTSTPQKETPNSISMQSSSTTPNNTTTTTRSKTNIHSNCNITNNNNSTNYNSTNKVKGIYNSIKRCVQSVCDVPAAKLEDQNQTSTKTVGSKETITFSKEVADTRTTRRCVRKTCRKKHPKRKEIRKKKGQQK